MDFELDAILSFSDDVRDAEEDIRRLIQEANEDLLKRGVPSGIDGGAEVKSFELVGDEDIEIHISSDRYVRAHDAVIRLRKKLSQEMGKKYHVGVREILIEDYRVRFEVEREPKEEIGVPYVDDITFDGSTCEIIITSLTEEQMKNNYVDRIINRIIEKVDAQYYEGKEEMWELIWESEKKEIAWEKDPTVEMEERGWIKKGPTKGKWFYRPEAAKILKTMEKIAVKEVLEPLGFQEIIESMMVPFEVWVDTGHMEGIPNEAYYISEPKTRDPSEWESIVDEIKISRDVPLDKLDKMTTEPIYGICYAQCPVMYWSLRNQTISDDSLPVLVYENSVPSARYESGGRHGIERVDEFHRIEPVYIGTKEQLLDLKEKLIERYRYVFEEILELEWRMANVTPFYLQQAGKGEEEGNTELGTTDFEAYLPYRGSREDSEWLEFQNLSIFKKYTEAFNIKSQTKELYSGCTGIGLERWTAAFLAQKGITMEDWPERFREEFGEEPKGLKLL